MLVVKDKTKAHNFIASNCRLKACLTLMWKVLTGMTTEEVKRFLDENNLLPEKQKGPISGQKEPAIYMYSSLVK